LRSARSLLRVLITAAVIAGFTMPAISAAAASPAASPSLSSLQQQIRTQSAALEKIVEQYDGVNVLLAKNQAAAVKLRADMAPTEALLTVAKENVATIATAEYMAGGQFTRLSAVISAANPTDLIGELTTMNQMASTRQKEVDALNLVQAQYTAQKLALDNLIKAETAQKQNLATTRTTIKSKLADLYKLRARAYGSPTVSGGSHPPPPYLPGRGGAVVKFAYEQLGKPYVFAADGPNSYDCSGLTMAAYRTVGVSLPHNAAMQWGVVHHISRAELSPGDLVFYRGLGHVAIYIGGGQVIHAPTPGDVVKISSVNMMTPYGYGRP
jgi:cell wall-associated NlpC family hydrolase